MVNRCFIGFMVWVLWILPSYPLFASSVSLIPNGLIATVAVSSPLVAGISGIISIFTGYAEIPTMAGRSKSSPLPHMILTAFGFNKLKPKRPYVIDPEAKALLHKRIPGQEFAAEHNWLREQLQRYHGTENTNLSKHYASTFVWLLV